MRSAVAAAIVWGAILCAAARAADPPAKPAGPTPAPIAPVIVRQSPSAKNAGSPAERAGEWKFESICLSDGRTYFGLIEAQRKGELDFAEIVRQPGKPMFCVVRPIDVKRVALTERLPAAERAELVARFQAFRSRAHIEAGRMEDVTLAETTRDGVGYLRYEGNWFTLLSTAGDETTRRMVVRIEQMFRAYRQILPPRPGRHEKVEILVYGSLAEYRADLARRRLEIENPAFYSANLNLIVAGSDLAPYARQLERIRANNETTRRHYDSLQSEFAKRLARLSEELKRNGFSRDEIGEELRLRRRMWEDEYKAFLAEVAEANRRNDALFGDVTRRMFARLNHEAFHAYLANFAYPQPEGQVPRWLNEGLAQIFEHGQLDGDLLRVDAPHRETLLALQADLAAGPLPLADLLTAQQRAFLVTHADGASKQHYLYSWGLAYYLTFQQNLLGSSALDRFALPEDAALSPIQRFEQLVGQPLADFEARWRVEMRALKPPAK